MSTKAPPRLVVQRQHTPPYAQRRAWLWLGLVWLASVLLAATIAYLLTAQDPLGTKHLAQVHGLQTENQALQKQVVTLTQALQVSRVATASLKDTLAQREEKINGLRADLTFYSHLIGGGAQHHGLRIQDVHLDPVGKSRAWNISVTLTHNVRRGAKVTGSMQVAVEGILDGKLTRLDWNKLSSKINQDGLTFNFRYFQQVRGTLMLPPHFIPNRLRIEANPDKGNSIVRTIDWNTALKSVEDNDVQQ